VLAVTAKIAAIVLVFDPYADQSFDLPKSLASRAFEWVLVALLVAGALRHGRALVPRSRLWIALAAVVAATGLSTVTAEVPYLALYGDVSRYLGLTHTVDMAVLAASVGVAFRGRRDWALLASGVAFALLVAVAYSIVQGAGRDPVGWLDDPRFQRSSTFGNTGFFAEFLVVIVAVCAAILSMRSGRWPLLAVPASLCGALGLALLAGFGARSSLLGLAAAAVSLFVVLVWRGASRRRAIAASLAAAGLVIVLGGLLSQTFLGTRAAATLTGAGLAERVAIYRVALAATAARPVLGWGPDSVGVFEPVFHNAQEERAGITVKNNSAHDWVLQASSTTGLAGLAALVTLVVATFTALRRALDRDALVATALIAAYAAFLTSSLTTVTAVSSAWIPWTVTGGAIALTGRLTGGHGLSQGRWGVVAAAGLLILAIAGASSGRTALEASRAMHAFRGAPDPGAALGLAEMAVTMDGGRPLYRDALAHALFLNGRFREAAAVYEEVTRRAPYDAQGWENLARAQVRRALANEAGDPRAGALAAAARATEVAPNDASAHAGRSAVARELGEYDLALREGVAAIALRPRDPELDALVAAAAGPATDATAGRAAVEPLVAVRDSATLRIALARLSLTLQDQTAVRRHAARALQIEPGNQEAERLLKQAGG